MSGAFSGGHYRESSRHKLPNRLRKVFCFDQFALAELPQEVHESDLADTKTLQGDWDALWGDSIPKVILQEFQFGTKIRESSEISDIVEERSSAP